MTPLWALGLSWAAGALMGATAWALGPGSRTLPERGLPWGEGSAAAHGARDEAAPMRLAQPLRRAAQALQAVQALSTPEATAQPAPAGATGPQPDTAAKTAQLMQNVQRLLEALVAQESLAQHTVKHNDALRTTLTRVSAAANGVDLKLGQVAPLFNEAALHSTAISDHLQALHDRARVSVSRGTALQSEWQGASGLLEQFKNTLEAMQDGVGAVHDLANKAKLLSLNAAIVASQSQEHSQGFSVVAEQIKTMAQRALNAAQTMAAGVGAVGEFQSQFAALTVQQAQTLATDADDHQALQQLTQVAMDTNLALRQLLSQRAEISTTEDPAVAALKEAAAELIGELIELGQALRLQDKDHRRTQAMCTALLQEAGALTHSKEAPSPKDREAAWMATCIAWLQRHERQSQLLKSCSRALAEAQEAAVSVDREVQTRTISANS